VQRARDQLDHFKIRTSTNDEKIQQFAYFIAQCSVTENINLESGYVRIPSNKKNGSKDSRVVDFTSRFIFLTDIEI
jgi:hypothetical protein